jgi:dienelactone hydrolase
LALLDIVTEVAIRYPGIDTERFFLIGFSGGGQFVHRFLYIHPERVIAASIGAPGRVTHFDKTLKWPQGVADVGDVFGKDGDAEKNIEILKKAKHIQMIVGGDDTEVPGNDFNEWVAKVKGKRPESTPGTLEPMWIARVETLRMLYDEWGSLGISPTFEIVEGVKHDSNGVHPAVEHFLQPLLKEWWSTKEA